ncbi:MAG: hypothetical protein HYT65_01205 [Candidatus Yanofskybacteria bacterium]|nr:hypothetical protein [Candidatus Yanofskybacteria bacterium]
MATAIQKNSICYNQKFGHDFKVAGGKCVKCGVDQNELSTGLQKIEYFAKQPAKGIHSERHALAKEISEFCGEPKKFGMYLGIIKNIGLPRAYQIFAEMRQAKEIKTPGKLFLYLSAYKKPAAKKPDGKHKRKTNGNHKRAGKNTPEKIKKRAKNNA